MYLSKFSVFHDVLELDYKAIEDRERENLPFVKKKIKQQKRNYAIPMQEFATVPIISKN